MFYTKVFFLILFFITIKTVNAQNFVSIHKEDMENYSNAGLSNEDYRLINQTSIAPKTKIEKNCTLNKIVFGWHPYWSNGLESNYEWNLLSDFAYFAYEVNPSTGNASNTYSWSTEPSVDTALSHGVRVSLCVTLFSSHATFFGSSSSQQTLITNIINLIQQRGAHGVNIDFESVPSANKTQLTNFIINLCNQMHTAMPASKVSMCLPAVDWSATYDVVAMMPYVDLFLIMGYDYYYSGSSEAGPTDPLYTHISTYNYNVSKSVTYYLNKGVPNTKLALGLPYYGREWPTSTNTVPSNTTATGVARKYNYVRDNANGYYSNPISYNKTMSTYYVFNDGSSWRQCFITDAYMMGRRYDMVNQRNLAGIGIWALGNDDGYNDLWQVIENKFTNCAVVTCSDTLYDMGGPQGNYFNNENYTYTIAPSGASGLSLSFNSFSTTAGSDTLKIYDGSTINAPLFGNYTGTNSPGTVYASGNALTLSFKSGSGTTATGWQAIWNCIQDTTPPSTSVVLPAQWVNNDFVVNFIDTDNPNGSGVGKTFYQVSDYNGSSWGANYNRGFLSDDFSFLNNQMWTTASNGGTWTILNGALHQTDETNANTNIYAPLNQNLSNRYLYHFNAKIEGADANKRFGFHFFCDSASYSNRKNSYFAWFRQSSNTLEIYKVSNDVFSVIASFPNVSIITGQWYDIKIVYDRITGVMTFYIDNTFIGSYTDINPYTLNGNYVSFRSGSCQLFVDSLNVFRTRTSSATILVGASNNKDLRFESQNMQTLTGRIKSIVADVANNLSVINKKEVFVDYSPPAIINWVNDGLSADIDTTTSVSSLSANWTTSSDNNTGIIAYWYAIGTTPGDSSLLTWTNNGLNQSITHSGLNLVHNILYHFSVKAQNGAGFFSNITSSNGQLAYFSTPVAASFSWNTDSICSGDSVCFTNLSSNANSFLWSFQGGTPASSTLANPKVVYNTPGIYPVQLIAFGNSTSDTLNFSALVNVFQKTLASFTSLDTTYFPNAYITFNNTSTFATSYLWDFGDGTNASDQNPWHLYNNLGTYTVTLFTSNNWCIDSSSKTISVLIQNAVADLSSDLKIHIFPNPFSNDFVLEIFTNQDAIICYDLFNVYGQCLLYKNSEIIQAGSNFLNFKNLNFPTAGIYFLNITLNEKNFKYKLIKF